MKALQYHAYSQCRHAVSKVLMAIALIKLVLSGNTSNIKSVFTHDLACRCNTVVVAIG